MNIDPAHEFIFFQQNILGSGGDPVTLSHGKLAIHSNGDINHQVGAKAVSMYLFHCLHSVH